MTPSDSANAAVNYDNRFLVIQTFAGLSQWIDVFLLFSVPSFLWKSSSSEIAMLASCFGLPSLFLGPIIGAFLDRSDPLKLAILGAIARTGLSAAIAFAPSFGMFAVLALLKGMANLLYWPASSILTNHVVRETARVRYFSSLSAIDQISKIVTPLLAGLISVLINSQRLFLLSAVATLICAILLLPLGEAGTINSNQEKRTVTGLFKDLGDGFRFIGSIPRTLLVSVLLGIGMSLALAIYDPHLAAFLDSKGFDASVFSLVVSATGAGAVAGALLVRFLLKGASQTILILSGAAVFAIAITVAATLIMFIPQLLGPAAFVAAWFLNGLGYEIFVIGCSVNMQNLCPQALLGRISTSVRSLQILAVVSGPGIGAWLITSTSRAMPFIVSAALAWLLVSGAIVMNVPATKRCTL